MALSARIDVMRVSVLFGVGGVLILFLGVVALSWSEKVEPNAEIAYEPTRDLLGCTATDDPAVRHGPREEMLVALTFDDGPSAQTPQVLRQLRRAQVHATFFVVGHEIAGDEWMLRRMIEDGDEIGNHTTTHSPLANIEDIARTSAIVERLTGFTPCHFRPPEGVQNRRMIADANSLGMNSVRWDVDSKDFLARSPQELREGVVGDVRPGSILLFHDGGGDRSTTIEALPGIIRDLRERGYEFVTVTELLGGEFELGELRLE